MPHEMKFDLDKLVKTAQALGIGIKVGSDNPGIHFNSEKGEITRTIKWEDMERVVNEIFGFDRHTKKPS